MNERWIPILAGGIGDVGGAGGAVVGGVVLKRAGQTTGEDTKEQETVEAAFSKNLNRFVLLAQEEVGIEK